MLTVYYMKDKKTGLTVFPVECTKGCLPKDEGWFFEVGKILKGYNKDSNIDMFPLAKEKMYKYCRRLCLSAHKSPKKTAEYILENVIRLIAK